MFTAETLIVSFVSAVISFKVWDVSVTVASSCLLAPLYTLYEDAPSTASHFTVTLSVVAVNDRFWGALGCSCVAEVLKFSRAGG